jgi:predicted membrane channel-forming protein YqfA (hemolysin III family)
MKSKISRKILSEAVLLLISLVLLLTLLSAYLMQEMTDYRIAIWIAFVAVYSIFFLLFMSTLYDVWNRHELENEGVKL